MKKLLPGILLGGFAYIKDDVIQMLTLVYNNVCKTP